MAFFATEEEKAARAKEKEEAFQRRVEAGKKQLEEQQRKDKQKTAEILNRYGLNFENYNEEKLREANAANIKNVASSLAGSSLYSFGNLITIGSNKDISFVINLQQAQIDQNWILIRQNEEMIRLLKEVAGKTQADTGE